MTARARLLAAAVAAAAAAAARAQTMLDQEERLIDIHALLLDLPPLQAPGALRPGALDASLEAVTIPRIDGTTGSKRQITASDRTPVFPRPRLAVGLPAPEGFRAFAGLSYIPPVPVREVSTNAAAAEAGLAWAPGPLRVGLRAHALWARARAPVTDPATRDVLEARAWGAELSAGAPLEIAGARVEPYAGAGLVALRGRFRVTSDGAVLRSAFAGPALHVGVRVLVRSRWELVTEVDGYPRRLVHTDVRLGYVFGG
ncbi:MAG TPA: hypothetical protein VF841_18310 [Anaeromyxobacter sp.]